MTQNIVTDSTLDAFMNMPVMEELDTPSNTEVLREAIDCFGSGKAPGSDSIPAEVLKSEKPVLLQPLHF